MDWTQQIRWTRAGPLWSLIWSSGLLKNGNGHRGIAFSPGVREFSALMNVEDKARYSSLAACYSHPGSFLTQLLSFRRPHCFYLNPTYLWYFSKMCSHFGQSNSFMKGRLVYHIKMVFLHWLLLIRNAMVLFWHYDALLKLRPLMTTWFPVNIDSVLENKGNPKGTSDLNKKNKYQKNFWKEKTCPPRPDVHRGVFSFSGHADDM